MNKFFIVFSPSLTKKATATRKFQLSENWQKIDGEKSCENVEDENVYRLENFDFRLCSSEKISSLNKHDLSKKRKFEKLVEGNENVRRKLKAG